MINRLLAIDPGNIHSAYVIMLDGEIEDKGKILNDEMIQLIREYRGALKHLAIEMIASYGMPVGASVFETCLWAGRFIERVDCEHTLIYRKDVKMYLCNSMRAKDGNIRQAIIDKYPPTGGGKTPQIGIKSAPGPLFGFAADMWAALGVALTYNNMVRI